MPSEDWQLLVVDDSAGDILITTKALEREVPAGLTVNITPASTLTQAAAVVRQAEFDCVLLDIRLPDANGIEGLERLKALAPQTPIIVLSGTDTPSVRQHAIASGAAAFIVKKPLSQSADIFSAVAQAVRR